MVADLDVTLVVIAVSFVFGLMTSFERLFGIVGILLGFLDGLYIENNGGLIANQYAYSGSAWVANTLSTQDVDIIVLLIGLIAVINAVLLIRASGFR